MIVPESGTNKYQVTASALRLRNGPSLSDRILTNMPNGSQMYAQTTETKYSNGINWFKINYNGVVGWASSKYLKLIEDNQVKDTVEVQTVQEKDVRKDITEEDVDEDFDPVKYLFGNNISPDDIVDAKKRHISSYYSVKAMPSLIGSPPQFSAKVDPRLNSSDYGRVYTEEFLVKSPMAVVIPGLPAYLNQLNKAEKQSLTSIVTATADKIAGKAEEIKEIFSGGDARLYEFRTQYTGYIKFLKSMCRLAAHYLGIENETVYGTNETYGSFNYDYLEQSNSTWSDLYGLESALTVYFNPNSGLSESASNSSGPSSLFSTLNGVSDKVNELKFLSGMAGADNTFEDHESYEVSAEQISKFVEDGDAGMFTKIFNRGAMAAATSIKEGGKLILPEIWKNSNYTKSYSLDISLRAVDGSAESLMLNVIYPTLSLLCLAMPRQMGANGYVAPFLIQAHSKGFFNCEVGMIDSISIKRSANSRTIQGIPTEVDINITIKDLYPTLSIGEDSTSPSSFFNNVGMIDFIATLTGLNLNKPDFARKLDAYVRSRVSNVTDIPGNIERSLIDSFRDTTRRLFGDF